MPDLLRRGRRLAPGAAPGRSDRGAGGRRSRAVRLLAAGGVAGSVAWAVAATGIEARPITFAKGACAATIQGTIRGSRTVDDPLRARAGRTLGVKLETRHGANCFNVLPPGSDAAAIFNGSRWRCTRAVERRQAAAGVLAAGGSGRTRQPQMAAKHAESAQRPARSERMG